MSQFEDLSPSLCIANGGDWICTSIANGQDGLCDRHRKKFYDALNNGGSSSYYELPQDCKTLQDIIVKQDMGFTQGNIFKAVYRWDKKPDLEYNLNKIIWFAQDALDRLYEQDPNNPRGCNHECDGD